MIVYLKLILSSSNFSFELIAKLIRALHENFEDKLIEKDSKLHSKLHNETKENSKELSFTLVKHKNLSEQKRFPVVTIDDINDRGDLDLEIVDKQVYQRLLHLEATISSQMMDEIKFNYELRSKNAKYRLNVSAICVKLITGNKSSVSIKETDVEHTPASEWK